MSLVTKLVLGGIFAVVLAICVIGAVLFIVAEDESGTIDVNLGDEVFEAIDAEEGAALVAEGGPLQFADVSGGTRPVVLQHLGDDPDRGWFAVNVLVPGTEACLAQWDADEEQFRDCEGTVYPADGTGLIRYRTTVQDGTVTVDLRVELDEDGAGSATTLSRQ